VKRRSDLNSSDYHQVMPRVLALMMYPNDTASQDHFARCMHEDLENRRTSDFLNTVLKSKAATASHHSGQVAGWVFLFILSLLEDPTNEASLSKAQFMVLRNGLRKNLRTIKADWTSHRSCAHFFAAENILDPNELGDKYPEFFVRVAHNLLDRARQLAKSRLGFDRGDWWVVGDPGVFEPVDIGPVNLTPSGCLKLRDYSAPIRR
jgi:hypothetical protein